MQSKAKATMEKVRVSTLKPGQSFAKGLFTASGQKLLNADTAMTERHITAIQRSGEMELLMADSMEEMVEAGLLDRFDRSKLAVGQKLHQGIVAKTGQVIVEAEQEIEAHHLDALEAGGGAAFASKDNSNHRRERIVLGDAMMDELLASAKTLELRIPVESNVNWGTPADASQFPPPDLLTLKRNADVESLRQIFAQVEAGVPVQSSRLDPILDGLIDTLSRFPTRFTQLALLCPRKEDYLPDHAYTVAVLAMAVAANLRWSRHDVRRTGLAGLVFDLGMLLVPERIRVGASELSDIDRSRVQRHPVFSLAMLQCVQTVEPILQLAALQHHERENGTGYPRMARGAAICDFAKVLAVADAFAATTEPRSYRRHKLPYIAMEEALRNASSMMLWKPAVRALIQAAGLFPVGSYVRLSNNKNAHVVASNPNQLNRPTVQPLDADGRPAGAAIDLATVAESTLTVVRPIASATG